jgi:hypothetical protein
MGKIVNRLLAAHAASSRGAKTARNTRPVYSTGDGVDAGRARARYEEQSRIEDELRFRRSVDRQIRQEFASANAWKRCGTRK